MIKNTTPKPVIEYSTRVNPYFPHQVLMETTSACQLRCSMCAREDALKKGALKIGHMAEWLALKIMDEVAAVNPKTRLWFCFFGEPTLSKQLAKRVKMAKERGIETTVINSNGNMLIPRISDELIESGLDEIYIGLDAATPETYAQIRVRGNYDKVVQNIHYLLKHKRSNLKVAVQYGVYEENEHELAQFKQYWSDFDVSIFIRPKLTWIGTLSEYHPNPENRHACAWIMDSLPIYHNGLVPYCVCDWDNRFPQGDIKTQSIAEIWQSSYRRWQNLHLANAFDKLPEFCRHCPDWKTKPLQGNLKKMNDERLTFDDIIMPKPSHIKTNDERNLQEERTSSDFFGSPKQSS